MVMFVNEIVTRNSLELRRHGAARVPPVGKTVWDFAFVIIEKQSAGRWT